MVISPEVSSRVLYQPKLLEMSNAIILKIYYTGDLKLYSRDYFFLHLTAEASYTVSKGRNVY